MSGNETIPYTLTFSFIALSHKVLTIQFAFQPYFYLILYLVIGTLSIMNMVIFAIYHRLVARPDRGRVAPFRFKSFFYLTVPPAFNGVSLALIPVFISNVIIAVVICGSVLTYQTNVFSCEFTSDADCAYTIFDLILDEPNNLNPNYKAMRNGRCGTSLLICGLYCMTVAMSIMIPDTTKMGRVYEAYNGNVWQYYRWKRSNMMFCSIWVVFYCLMAIQFSFS
jgi:hypothetical protein